MMKSNRFPWLQCFRGTSPFAANKNESRRRCTERDSNALFSPLIMTSTIAVLMAEGELLHVFRKINTLVQVKCPMGAHISPFTA